MHLLLRVLSVGLLLLGAAACESGTPFDPNLDLKYRWALQDSMPTRSSWGALRNVVFTLNGSDAGFTGFSASRGQTVTGGVSEPEYSSPELRFRISRFASSLTPQEAFFLAFEGRMQDSDRITGQFVASNGSGGKVVLSTATLVRVPR